MPRGWIGIVLALLLQGGCQSLCEQKSLPTCDIRQADCQSTVLEALACLRVKRLEETPPIRVVSPEEYGELLRPYFQPSPATPVIEGALRQLGVLPEDLGVLDAQMQTRMDFTGAYFLPMDRTVYIIDRGQPLDDANAVTLLLHELTHASQHAESDLTTLAEATETTEASVRLNMAVEGEASFYASWAAAWIEGHAAIEELDWRTYFVDSVTATSEAVRESRVPYIAAQLFFPYAIGARHDAAFALRGGDVPAVLGAVPGSTVFMTDPFRSPSSPAERLETSPCEPPPPPPDYEAAIQDERGPLFLYAFLLPLIPGGDHDTAWRLASSWQRDDLHVYSHADGRVALVWRIHLTRYSYAAEIAALAATDSRAAAAVHSVLTIQSGGAGEGGTWSWEARVDACAPATP